MRKQILLYFTVLLCLAGLATNPASAQNPTIAYPENGSRIDPTNFTVTGTVGSTGIRRVAVTFVNVNNPTDTDVIVVNIPNNQPASRVYEANLDDFLTAGQTYNIRVETFNNTSLTPPAIGTATVTNILAVTPTAPVTTPEDLSLSNPCGFSFEISPYPGATVFSIQYRQSSDQNFNNNTPSINSNVSTTGPYTATFSNTQLQANIADYQMRIIPGTIVDGSFSPIQGALTTTKNFSTGPIPNAAPVITAPANGATNLSIFPNISIAAYTGCGILGTPTVVIDENGDFTGTDVVAATTYNVAGTNPGPYSVAFNQPLKNGTTYYVRVGFPVTLNGKPETYFNTQPFTFSTIAGPVVLTPTSAQYSSLPTCFRISVAGYEGAQSVRALWRLSSGTTFNNASSFVNGTGPYEVAVSGLQITSSYVIRIQAWSGTGGTGVLLGYTDFNITTNNTTPSSLPVFVYPPTPANGATGVTLNPTIRIAPFAGCGDLVQLRVEVFQGSTTTGSRVQTFTFNSNTTGSQPEYYDYYVSPSLLPNTFHTVRATYVVNNLSDSFSSETSFTTGNFLAQTQPVSYYNNGVETPFVNGAFRNALTQRFRAAAVIGASLYDWQFDDDPNFGSPIEYLGQGNDFTFSAFAPGFRSGGLYYVRIRATNGSTAGTYPEPGSPAIVSYHHPLFQPQMTSPVTTDWAQRNFSIKSTVVESANEYYFQVVKANTANDGNPLADFSDPSLSFVNPYGGNTTYNLSSDGAVEPVQTLGGNVILNNRWRQFDWGVEVSYGSLLVQPRTMYRSRVVAVRRVNGQVVQQSVIGGITTFGTMGISPRVHVIRNIADGETGIENRESQSYTRIVVAGSGLDWDLTEYQLQVSETPFTDNSTAQGSVYSITGVTQYDPHFFVSGLKFGTRYYVRARSIGTEDGIAGVASPWTGPVVAGGVQGGISFVTKGMPAPDGINLRDIATNRSALVSVSQVGVADRYEWTLIRTSAPPVSHPEKVTDWVNTTFSEYLVQGASYRLEVRAFSSAQESELAGYSLPVVAEFTVASNAARASNDPAAAGTAEFLPSVILPNPFRERTHLQLNTGYGKVEVRATDLTGRVLMVREATGGDTVPLGLEWPAGVYIIQVVDANGVKETRRIVKQ